MDCKIVHILILIKIEREGGHFSALGIVTDKSVPLYVVGGRRVLSMVETRSTIVSLPQIWISSVREEAERLKSQEGVEILIALGHSGYELDVKLAAEVADIDVVVGGHSHTFLWTGAFSIS
jgi:hypothetical protein